MRKVKLNISHYRGYESLLHTLSSATNVATDVYANVQGCVPLQFYSHTLKFNFFTSCENFHITNLVFKIIPTSHPSQRNKEILRLWAIQKQDTCQIWPEGYSLSILILLNSHQKDLPILEVSFTKNDGTTWRKSSSARITVLNFQEHRHRWPGRGGVEVGQDMYTRYSPVQLVVQTCDKVLFFYSK